jgi:small-conductance mechanosensitive channel
MNLLDLVPGWAKASAIAARAAAAVGFVSYQVHHQREIGRAEVRAEWDAAALAEAQSNARESLRRLERQQENQRDQNAQLAAARADADRNRAAADGLREQNADAVRRWRAALDHPATGGECAAAGDAIGVLADVLSRADRRAGILAAYADAARAAGLQCERDYSALTSAPAAPGAPP